SDFFVPVRATECRFVPLHPNIAVVSCQGIPPSAAPVQNCGAQTEHASRGCVRWLGVSFSEVVTRRSERISQSGGSEGIRRGSKEPPMETGPTSRSPERTPK